MSKKYGMISIVENAKSAAEIILNAQSATYRELFTETQITYMKVLFANEMLESEPDPEYALLRVREIARVYLI